MKKNDVYIILGLIVLSICIFLLNIYNKNDGKTVIIYYNNEEYAVETLDVNKVIKVNETNVVRIENGKVFMESAECPDQICVKQKPLNLSGRDIVCLPNKVTVRVVSENKDVDVVTR